MSHLEYLERSGVQRELQEVLRELVSQQPADPISFLAKHFDHLRKPERDAILISSELLGETDTLDRDKIDSAIYRAFTLLTTDTDSGEDIIKRRIQSISVDKLVRELCCHLCIDTNVTESLLDKLHIPSAGAVLPYDFFKSVIKTVLNLQAYLKMAKEVFDAIDTNQTGSIKSHVGKEIMSRLDATLSASHTDNESSELAEIHPLSPAEISAIIQRGTYKEDPAMSLKDFQTLASQTFIKHYLPCPTHSDH